MIKEVLGITGNANAKKEFCQTQYFVPWKLQTQDQELEHLKRIKPPKIIPCSIKYASIHLYIPRSRICKCCEPSNNWRGGWKRTLMFICLNNFFIKIKGPIICIAFLCTLDRWYYIKNQLKKQLYSPANLPLKSPAELSTDSNAKLSFLKFQILWHLGNEIEKIDLHL